MVYYCPGLRKCVHYIRVLARYHPNILERIRYVENDITNVQDLRQEIEYMYRHNYILLQNLKNDLFLSKILQLKLKHLCGKILKLDTTSQFAEKLDSVIFKEGDIIDLVFSCNEKRLSVKLHGESDMNMGVYYIGNSIVDKVEFPTINNNLRCLLPVCSWKYVKKESIRV